MRTKNSIRNIIAALIGQVLGILLSFVSRIIFIRTLGAEYLGINGLFTNVLSILCLAEMGVGPAIIYSLYKPLAVKDESKVKALMNFYENAYRLIGVIIFVLGICLIPFLDYIIKGQEKIPYLVTVYLLFLINTVVSYFWAYKRSLIIADQKNYIATIYRYGFYILLNVVQIILLLLTRNFILFLVAQIAATVLENLSVAHKADQLYPFLRDKEKVKLDKESVKEITKNIKAMMCHKIGGVVVNGTDNILISSFLGVIWVGLYSNYYLVTNALTLIIGQIFKAVTASIGNLNVLESKEKSYQIYKRVLFMNFWMAGFCSISLWVLFNPFINLWIGEEYVLSPVIVAIIILNFYMAMIRKTTLTYRDSMGLFWRDRYKPILEAAINLIVSIILAPRLGIAGIFIGTFVSTVSTSFWIEPYILYKYGFERKLREFFGLCIKYTLIIVAVGGITWGLCSFFAEVNWMNFIAQCAICGIVPNMIFFLIFYKKDELKYFLNLLKKRKVSVNTL